LSPGLFSSSLVQKEPVTPTPLGVIEVAKRFSGKPAEIAVVLSHEIIHAERHDPFAMPSEYSLEAGIPSREDEVAHTKSLWTATVLWPQMSYSLGGSQYAVAQSLPEFRRHNGMIPMSCAPLTSARKKNKYFLFLFIDKFALAMQRFRRVSNPQSA
jgi:hypothetical protein